MKIQCDVCYKDEASAFCTADEAALCSSCDHRVHHANKLASKHQRFSLLYPSSKQFPLCDICQEKRAFLFCQQDRAILCRECDHPIHSVNEHTQKHNRFLLTGVKLSPSSSVYGTSSSDNPVPNPKTTDHRQTSLKKSISAAISNPQANSVPSKSSAASTSTAKASLENNNNSSTNNEIGLTSSSISEYLIETLPGWHVEDFLDSSSPFTFGFCEGDDGISPFLDCDLESSKMGSFSAKNVGIWVPQAPPAAAAPPLYPSELGKVIVGWKETKEATNFKSNSTASRTWSDDGFTVPQINLPSSGSKRSRPFW